MLPQTKPRSDPNHPPSAIYPSPSSSSQYTTLQTRPLILPLQPPSLITPSPSNPHSSSSPKLHLLLRPLHGRRKSHAILRIKLHRHLRVAQAFVVQAARFDARCIRHDFEFSVEGGAAIYVLGM